MGRYYKSPQPVFVDGNIYQPPFEIIVGTLKGIDQDIEANKAALEGARASVLNPDVLEPDRPYVTRKSKEFQGKIDNLTSMVAKDPLGFRNKYSEISELQKDITREYTTGATGKAINQKAYIDDFVKKHTERIEKEKGYVTVEDINWARNFALTKYEEGGGLNFNAEKGTYNSISSHLPLALTPTVDLQQLVNDALKDIKPKERTEHDVKIGGKWITSTIDRSKGYNVEDLRAIANASINGNQKAWDYLNQQKGFGRWDNRDLDKMIQNAIYTGANAKGYESEREWGEKNVEMNPEYKLGLEEAKEKRVKKFEKDLENTTFTPDFKYRPENAERPVTSDPYKANSDLGNKRRKLEEQNKKLSPGSAQYKQNVESIKDIQEQMNNYSALMVQGDNAWRKYIVANAKRLGLSEKDAKLYSTMSPFELSKLGKKKESYISSDSSTGKRTMTRTPIAENIKFNNILKTSQQFLNGGLAGDAKDAGFLNNYKDNLGFDRLVVNTSTIAMGEYDKILKTEPGNALLSILANTPIESLNGRTATEVYGEEVFNHIQTGDYYKSGDGMKLEIIHTGTGKAKGEKIQVKVPNESNFYSVMEKEALESDQSPNSFTFGITHPSLYYAADKIRRLAVTNENGIGGSFSRTIDGNTYTTYRQQVVDLNGNVRSVPVVVFQDGNEQKPIEHYTDETGMPRSIRTDEDAVSFYDYMYRKSPNK